ncbi:hypothetical protein CHS0354_010278, partial [Potamilus streckersoni]
EGNHVNKMQRIQEEVDVIGIVEEMLVRLEDGCYSLHRVQMKINNLIKAKERVMELIKEEKEDKEERNK